MFTTILLDAFPRAVQDPCKIGKANSSKLGRAKFGEVSPLEGKPPTFRIVSLLFFWIFFFFFFLFFFFLVFFRRIIWHWRREGRFHRAKLRKYIRPTPRLRSLPFLTKTKYTKPKEMNQCRKNMLYYNGKQSDGRTEALETKLAQYSNT